MSIKLDSELKQRYIEAIHILWPGPDIAEFGADSVTESVVELVDSVLERIASCSKPVAGIDAMFQNFYVPFSIDKWPTILKKFFKVYKKWVDTLRKNRRYKLCINSVTRDTHSEIKTRLIGIY